MLAARSTGSRGSAATRPGSPPSGPIRRRATSSSGAAAVWCGDGEPPHIALLDHTAVAPVIDQAVEVALLGVDGGTAYFAVGLPASIDDPTEGPLAGLGAFEDLRAVGGRLTAPEAAMLALSRGIMYWHERHLFCGVCGSPTASRDAGFIRLCTNDACNAQHFPRTDPAVIMAVSDGDYCLLGRGRDWPEGQYSTLAGFAEPGESLERGGRPRGRRGIGYRGAQRALSLVAAVAVPRLDHARLPRRSGDHRGDGQPRRA